MYERRSVRVLFGDIWERQGLSKRHRSLVTVTVLIALNRPEQLRHYLQRARDNGVTKDEIVETITHLARHRRRTHGGCA